jgi:hypothetical protein
MVVDKKINSNSKSNKQLFGTQIPLVIDCINNEMSNNNSKQYNMSNNRKSVTHIKDDDNK